MCADENESHYFFYLKGYKIRWCYGWWCWAGVVGRGAGGGMTDRLYCGWSKTKRPKDDPRAKHTQHTRTTNFCLAIESTVRESRPSVHPSICPPVCPLSRSQVRRQSSKRELQCAELYSNRVITRKKCNCATEITVLKLVIKVSKSMQQYI